MGTLMSGPRGLALFDNLPLDYYASAPNRRPIRNPGGRHLVGCPSREAVAERAYEIECPSRHPEVNHLRCFREAGHGGLHLADDWNLEATPGRYGRLGLQVGWSDES